MTEVWKDVVGYEGFYSVSDHGRLRSEPRMIVDSLGRERRVRGRMMSLPANQGGYVHVSLCREGDRKDAVVHQLVLRAFVGDKPTPKHEGCHNDGKPANNRLENLRWDTMTANQHDRLKHGTDIRGEKCGTSRFTEAQVRLMRKVRSQFTLNELAGIFNASISGVHKAQTGYSWAWMK